ncbi:uncharacterized protein LOC121987771 [Zingiber officinale]|uniref:uncharacterized protein LOC121987771 n=1 Tax=Zingiber officinale TaxID=94328 RepID=UPI001C4B8159|nr:uncharacterized protein LOC121987771 [Zingiber officinale]
MFDPDHQSLCGGGSAPPSSPMTNPRISFSGDFLMEVPAARAPAGPPPDPNFEFLVGSHPMITADQLFSKGRLLPLKDPYGSGSSGRAGGGLTTLRDELREKDSAGGVAASAYGRERPPKGATSIKWKELLGLKKPRGSALKKMDKSEGGAGDADARLGKAMQEL